MKCIVGLGNPGADYEMTRHNAGFLAIDHLLKAWTTSGMIGDTSIVNAKEYQAYESRYQYPDGRSETVTLLKPLTFMNLSGTAIAKYLSYHSGISITDDIWVLHDELDIPFGRIKVDFARSSAGNNGVQNIIDVLQTKEFTRLRIGIGSSRPRTMTTQQYVLKEFSATEKDGLEDVWSLVQSTLEHGLQFGRASAQNYANTK